MKIYIVGNFDGNTDVVLEEEMAINAYTKNAKTDNGAWIEVWMDNQEQVNDPIHKRVAQM